MRSPSAPDHFCKFRPTRCAAVPCDLQTQLLGSFRFSGAAAGPSDSIARQFSVCWRGSFKSTVSFFLPRCACGLPGRTVRYRLLGRSVGEAAGDLQGSWITSADFAHRLVSYRPLCDRAEGASAGQSDSRSGMRSGMPNSASRTLRFVRRRSVDRLSLAIPGEAARSVGGVGLLGPPEAAVEGAEPREVVRADGGNGDAGGNGRGRSSHNMDTTSRSRAAASALASRLRQVSRGTPAVH